MSGPTAAVIRWRIAVAMMTRPASATVYTVDLNAGPYQHRRRACDKSRRVYGAAALSVFLNVGLRFCDLITRLYRRDLRQLDGQRRL